ncbi:MAG: hypothetical protein IKQ91_06635 [Oscillospiraceae bacterium]|nr:hypothetical protein [Oscillospiraceae bacterium]
MKKSNRAAAILNAVLMLSAAWPVSAEPVQDPDYGDVLLLQSEDAAEEADAGDPLCNVINSVREENGAQNVVCDEGLMELATERVAALDGSSAAADAGAVGYEIASETVIRGRADLNTMICSILLSEKQLRNLTDNRYMMIGYASNEAETLWVLLMARPVDVNETNAE